MKRCSMCGETKPATDFMWRRIKDDLRDSYCRPCRAIYKQDHYAANKQRYIDNAQAYNKGVARKRTAWLLEYFETHPCVDCAETDPVVLEFDHLRDKSFSISSAFGYKNWNLVLAEIAKCDVVCANCHRRRTANRGGTRRADVAQLVERRPSTANVASSSLVIRSKSELENQAHHDGVPEFATPAAVVLDEATFDLEAELLVEPDSRVVVWPDGQCDLVRLYRAGPFQTRLQEC